MKLFVSSAKVQQKLHMCKFLSGNFEKVENSLLLLGIDSRHYACIRDGYLALKERAQPFSKIQLTLAYVPQDANVLSGELRSKAASEVQTKFCIYTNK